jgi:hypothetical protein
VIRLAHAADCAAMVACVRRAYAAMHENIALYQRLGYAIVDRREDEGFHRVFMRKRLMPPSAEFPPASSS